MPRQDIVVIGGSAGGLEALVNILTGLPSNLESTIFAVLHTAPQGSSALPQILARSTALSVAFAADGAAVKKSHVYVAPPDHHLTLGEGVMSVRRGPKENGFRPAIDPLFRSAASIGESRVVGVIVSGALDDGTFGLMAIKQSGGTSIVQHPYEAFVPSMPLSAIQNVEVDYIVRTEEIAPLLVQAAQSGLQSTRLPALKHSPPTEAAGGGQRDTTLEMKRPDAIPAPPSSFVCPKCGGALWEMKENDLQRFRCHTGHGFTIETLLASQNGKLEGALERRRVLMERAALHRQIADRTESRGMNFASQRHRERAHIEEQNAQFICDMLAGMNVSTPGADPPHNQISQGFLAET